MDQGTPPTTSGTPAATLVFECGLVVGAVCVVTTLQTVRQRRKAIFSHYEQLGISRFRFLFFDDHVCCVTDSSTAKYPYSVCQGLKRTRDRLIITLGPNNSYILVPSEDATPERESFLRERMPGAHAGKFFRIQVISTVVRAALCAFLASLAIQIWTFVPTCSYELFVQSERNGVAQHMTLNRQTHEVTFDYTGDERPRGTYETHIEDEVLSYDGLIRELESRKVDYRTE